MDGSFTLGSAVERTADGTSDGKQHTRSPMLRPLQIFCGPIGAILLRPAAEIFAAAAMDGPMRNSNQIKQNYFKFSLRVTTTNFRIHIYYQVSMNLLKNN